MRVIQESIFFPVTSRDRLHLRRIYSDPRGAPIFMLHGSVENGRIFYTPSGKGLAPFLARHGFDVYVGELRGRGEGCPPIGPRSSHGQTEAITEDIPAFLRAVLRFRGAIPHQWVAHSWGGVLLASYWARFAELRPLVDSMVFFASKRRIRVSHLERSLKIDLGWNLLGQALVAAFGYLPARGLRLGSDNETRESHRQNRLWIRPGSAWTDPGDGFRYGDAIRSAPPPPTFHLVGGGDTYLGHPLDVGDFLREMGARRTRLDLLSRAAGNRHDYGHVDILVHPDAPDDHFPRIVEWLRENASGGR